MKLATFAFDDQAVRTDVVDGDPWFLANDVCFALEYKNPRDAIAKHVDSDDVAKRDVIDTIGRQQQTNFINESGMWSLVFGSKKESAKRFKRWVTSEVLPALRQTGGYQMTAALPQQGQPFNLNHRADNLVSAGRVFREMMRTCASMRMNTVESMRIARQCTLRQTGVDLFLEVGISEASLAEESKQQEGFVSDFVSLWLAGDLALPVCACLGSDLYTAYIGWCQSSTNPYRASIQQFRAAIKQKFSQQLVFKHAANARMAIPIEHLTLPNKEKLAQVADFKSALEMFLSDSMSEG